MRPRAYPHVSQRPGRRTIKVRKHEMDPRKLGHAFRIGGCSPSISAWGPTCFRGLRNYERNPLESLCATPLRPPSRLINRGCASSTARHAPSASARPTTSDFGGAPPRSRLSSHRDLAVVPGVLLLRDPGESHATSELAQSRHHRRDPRKSRDPITWPEGFCSSLSAGLGPASCAGLGSTASPPPSNLAGVLEWCPQTSRAKVPAPQGMCPLYLAFAASSPRGTASWPLCTGHPSRLVGMGTPSNASWHG